MRSMMAACVVLMVSVALLARAGERASTTMVPVATAIEKVSKDPKARGQLAAVRFLGEVLGAKQIEFFDGELSVESGYLHEAAAQQLIMKRSCDALTPAELKAATALTDAFKAELPMTMKAYALGQQGKADEAAKLLAPWVESLMPKGAECPSEHPDSGSERLNKMTFGLMCLQKLAPKFDRTKLEKLRTKAMGCAVNNLAVG